MKYDEDKLVERVKGCVLKDKALSQSYAGRNQKANPLVTHEDIDHAEARIGFSLPTILKRLYLEVGNGGFGPGYGLLPLNDDKDPNALETDSLVTTYLASHPTIQGQKEDIDSFPPLPEKVIMICDWGCNIYSWLDYSQVELPVLRAEATLDCSKFTIESPSFCSWLEDWLQECDE